MSNSIAKQWQSYATKLAPRFRELFFNRTDVYGGYGVREGKVSPFTYPTHKDERKPGVITDARLTSHFYGSVMGAHASNLDNMGKWLCVDMDDHNKNADDRELAQYGITLRLSSLVDWLESRLIRYMTEYSGRGVHVWVLFDEPTPTQKLYELGQYLARWVALGHADAGGPHSSLQLDEAFPKANALGSGRQYGNWVRLPGPHWKDKTAYSAFWIDEPERKLLEGAEACEYLLTLKRNSPTVLDGLDLTVPEPEPVAPKYQNIELPDKPTTTTLDKAKRHVANYPPAISGSGGDMHTFKLFVDLCYGYALDDKTALAITQEWNQTCQPSWTDHELEHKAACAARVTDGHYPKGWRTVECSVLCDSTYDVSFANVPIEYPFPKDALPAVVGNFCETMSSSYKVPLGAYALAALAASAGAIGNRAMLTLNCTETIPATFWGALFGYPGSGKSPIIATCVKPYHKLHSSATSEYQINVDAYVNKSKTDKLPFPRCKSPLCNDLTIEAYAEQLQAFPAGLFCFHAEGGAFFNVSEYKNAGDNSGLFKLNPLFDGAMWTIHRKGKPGQPPRIDTIEQATASFLVGVQPDVFHELKNVKIMAQSGFAARFYFARTTTPDDPDDPIEPEPYQDFETAIQSLLNHDYYATTMLTLTADARKLYKAFGRDNIHGVVTPNHFLVKQKYKAAKMAIVIAILENKDSVDSDIMGRAIELAKWFYNETRIVIAARGAAQYYQPQMS